MITLTTDFGDSHYVGAMRGAILQIHPEARVVDVTHAVPPQDVVSGALALASAAPYFPEAVHVCVVDPGVGTDRRGLLIECERGLLVGPDNGVLIPAARALGGVARAYSLESPDLWLDEVSATFHGRDVFAPVAAHLDRGAAPERAGPQVTEWTNLTFGTPRESGDALEVDVITVDPFGNCVTNARHEHARDRFRPGDEVRVTTPAGEATVPYRATYGTVPPGEPLLLVGSTGYLELAVNQGSAADRFQLARGDALTLHTG